MYAFVSASGLPGLLRRDSTWLGLTQGPPGPKEQIVRFGVPRSRLMAPMDPETNSFVSSILRGATVLAAAGILTLPNVSGAYGLTQSGRIDKCRGDEACISTSSVSNPSKFGPPWTYEPQTSDPNEAWTALKAAILRNPDAGRIVESLDGPIDYYLRAEFPSFGKGIDDVEFRMLPSEELVTYRSASREAIFIYPLQTPIDSGKNRNRLKQIRAELGWSELDGGIATSASSEPSRSPDFLPDYN